AAGHGRGCRRRIDSPCTDRFEPLVHAGSAETPLDERVHRERRQMTLVKNHGISQRDGPLVVGLVIEQVEQGPRARTHALETIQNRSAVQLDARRGPSHRHLPLCTPSACRLNRPCTHPPWPSATYSETRA